MASKQTVSWLFFLVLILFASFVASGSENKQSALTVVPEQIQIGSIYNGAELRVTSNTLACDGAVIVVKGDNEEITLNRKGRVAVIWMNVARITISGVPGIYIMASSEKLDKICSKETQEKLGLGLESLRASVNISSDNSLTGEEFDQFLKLKFDKGTYNTKNNIELKSTPTGKMEISAVLPIPSEMPPGIYEINLYCFREGKVVDRQSTPLRIERIGLPRTIKNLSENNSAMYGIIAIIAAMMAGAIMSIIFSSLPGKRRR